MKEEGKFPKLHQLAGRLWRIHINERDKDMLIEYVKNQKEHPKTERFYMNTKGF